MNVEKRKIAQAEYQKNYVRSSKKDMIYEQLLELQKQDTIVLSYNAHLDSNSKKTSANVLADTFKLTDKKENEESNSSSSSNI